MDNQNQTNYKSPVPESTPLPSEQQSSEQFIPPQAPKLKKLIIIISMVVVLLIAGCVSAYYFYGEEIKERIPFLKSEKLGTGQPINDILEGKEQLIKKDELISACNKDDDCKLIKAIDKRYDPELQDALYECFNKEYVDPNWIILEQDNNGCSCKNNVCLVPDGPFPSGFTFDEKQLWEKSVCGNDICEPCESDDECCNYPCQGEVCPPPTCLGWCPEDCKIEEGICGPRRMGENYDMSNCDKSCSISDDCIFTCGCGAINKNEICHDEGSVYDCVSRSVDCQAGECIFKEEKFPPSISIKTDKTEYEQGEDIKIIVENNFNAPIFFTAADRFWSLEYFKDGKWVNPGYEKDGFQLAEKEEKMGEKCSIALFEMPTPTKLEAHSDMSYVWDQRICSFEEQTVSNIKEFLEGIRYRVFFGYGYEVSEDDPLEIVSRKIIFGDEFIIK